MPILKKFGYANLKELVEEIYMFHDVDGNVMQLFKLAAEFNKALASCKNNFLRQIQKVCNETLTPEEGLLVFFSVIMVIEKTLDRGSPLNPSSLKGFFDCVFNGRYTDAIKGDVFKNAFISAFPGKDEAIKCYKAFDDRFGRIKLAVGTKKFEPLLNVSGLLPIIFDSSVISSVLPKLNAEKLKMERQKEAEQKEEERLEKERASQSGVLGDDDDEVNEILQHYMDMSTQTVVPDSTRRHSGLEHDFQPFDYSQGAVEDDDSQMPAQLPQNIGTKRSGFSGAGYHSTIGKGVAEIPDYSGEPSVFTPTLYRNPTDDDDDEFYVPLKVSPVAAPTPVKPSKTDAVRKKRKHTTKDKVLAEVNKKFPDLLKELNVNLVDEFPVMLGSHGVRTYQNDKVILKYSVEIPKHVSKTVLPIVHIKVFKLARVATPKEKISILVDAVGRVLDEARRSSAAEMETRGILREADEKERKRKYGH